MTRTREQIVEEIIDAVQDLFDNAEPTDESQIYQEYYYIPSRPLDLICLNLIPELDELDPVTQESKSTGGGAWRRPLFFVARGDNNCYMKGIKRRLFIV